MNVEKEIIKLIKQKGPLTGAEIMETIEMISVQNLDVRTVTMGINVLDCADPDLEALCTTLKEKVLRTTRASGENRQTPFKNIEREARLIVLQGVERGRAFSLTIEEDTGVASIAVSMNGVTISVFGACTPLQ